MDKIVYTQDFLDKQYEWAIQFMKWLDLDLLEKRGTITKSDKEYSNTVTAEQTLFKVEYIGK